jgi:hypothetical protein
LIGDEIEVHQFHGHEERGEVEKVVVGEVLEKSVENGSTIDWVTVGSLESIEPGVGSED